MELKKGMLAISKAGHDKDCWYVVLEAGGEDTLLVNGRNRTIAQPKKKKRKHLQPVYEVPGILQKALTENRTWTNEEVKRALKLAKRD